MESKMYDMHPVDGVMRVQSIVKAIAKVLRDNGPTSRRDLQAKVRDLQAKVSKQNSSYKASEIDAALSNVKYVVDENDILSIAP
jgi:hypothetical protein